MPCQIQQFAQTPFLLDRKLESMTKAIRFQILIEARITMTLFPHVATCSMVEIYRRFGGTAFIIRGIWNTMHCSHTYLDDGGNKLI
jgi:hypothetical protein